MESIDITPDITPRDIQLHKLSAQVFITWCDGRTDQFYGQQLRRYCACSRCRARNQLGVALLNDDSGIEALHLMGVAGLQVVFADGHDRGIFPWGYLRAIAEHRALEYLND